jgi:hypothetical protein
MVRHHRPWQLYVHQGIGNLGALSVFDTAHAADI